MQFVIILHDIYDFSLKEGIYELINCVTYIVNLKHNS